MKVLVTGASGDLGTKLIPQLLAEGWTPLAIDRKPRGDEPVVVRDVDLRQTDAVKALFEEPVDALVHLANMSSWIVAEPEIALNQNLTMCTNLFQAAIKAGVKKIVFASSIHAFVGVTPDQSRSICETVVPYLPVDGDAPAWPACPYGLMKSLAEQMLQFHSRVHGVTTFSLRFPWLAPLERIEARQQVDRPPQVIALAGVFSWLTYEDAAALVVACLKSQVTGSRTYLPASPIPTTGKPVADIIREHYSNIPLRRPLEQITSLVDVSRIERDTGWRPSH
jgi:nucleoside-diphosphate-sugar epimerase